MTISEQDILQNIVLKVLAKEVSFEAEPAVLSWVLITVHRGGTKWNLRVA